MTQTAKPQMRPSFEKDPNYGAPTMSNDEREIKGERSRVGWFYTVHILIPTALF